MGKSMDRQKNFRCLVLGVVSLASTREAPGPDQATQRNLVNEGGTPHAARRTPGEALQLRCNFNVWHCTPWPASHSLSCSSASKTGRLGHTSRICASRDWVYPCAGAEHWRVEAWNFPGNGGEAIVAWSFGSESRDGGPGLYPIARALFDPVFDSGSTTSGLQLPRGGAGERPATISRR